jgi:hypothetical protein
MSDPAYKYFDEADNFLANLMEFFPSLYGKVVTLQQEEDAVNKLIQPTFTNSSEFCHCVQSKRGIITRNYLAQGGRGAIMDFLINEDQFNQPVYAIIVSINPNGGFEPFYVPVIIKTGLDPTDIEIYSNTIVKLRAGAGAGLGNKQIKIITIKDPLTEIVFGSMLGHLYDLGLCPFYAKYFSTYICNINPNPQDSDENFNTHFVIEKSNISMGNFMHENRYIQAIIRDREILMNIIFQYIYAVYIGKMYLGFTHFDAHLGNVMITHTSNQAIAGTENISYVYHGKNLETKQFILIDLGLYKGKNSWLAMKYNGLMVKIIDYGTCAAYLYAAEYPKYKRDFLIRTQTLRYLPDTVYQICRNSSQQRNTWEIQFFLTCLHQSMYNGHAVGMPPDVVRRTIYQNNINDLDYFTEQFYNSAQYNIGTYLDTNPHMKNIRYGNVSAFPERSMNIDIPAFSDPRELLRGLARYCESLNHITENTDRGTVFYLETDLAGAVFTSDNSLIFEDEPNELVKSFNNMDKFIQIAKKVETGCNGKKISDDIFNEYDESQLAKGLDIDHSDDNRLKLCTEAKEEMKKWHPANTMKSKLYSPLNKNTFYDEGDGRFNNNIELTQSNFPRQLQAKDSERNLSIFKMQINPKALVMNRVDPGALVYSTHQNWLDYNPLTDKLTHNRKQIEIVRLNIIVLDPKGTYNVKLNYLSNLWDVTKLATTTCFSINAGYYAIPQQNFEQRRVGFFYNEDVTDGTNGTYLPVPKPYRPHFGVIWCSHTNVLHIDTHEEFMSWHETIDQPIGYFLDDGSIYTTLQPVIKMEGHSNAIITEGLRGNTPVMSNGNRPYKWAFCSGVLLVDNSKVVFDLHTMLDTQFLIVDSDQPANTSAIPKPPDLTTYKLLQESGNNYKFKSADNGDMYDSYGVKVSNRYSTHNVMGITNTGKIMFFLVEGRGFNAVGLDRVQVAYLVDKFGIHKAISLDGGFSANAVYKMDDDTPKYVQNYPQKQKLSTSMTFTFNDPEDMVHPEEIGYRYIYSDPTNVFI